MKSRAGLRNPTRVTGDGKHLTSRESSGGSSWEMHVDRASIARETGPLGPGTTFAHPKIVRSSLPVFVLGTALLVAACSSPGITDGTADASITNGDGTSSAGDGAGDPSTAGGADPKAPPDCAITATTSALPLVTATADGEAILTVEASALSKTSWAEKGNEAVVLEVLREGKRLAHLVLHQGQERFSYAMHAGALKAGDALTVRVSDLSAPKATKSACIAKATLSAPAANMLEGVAHAPIVKWPKEKSFNDLPVLLGWSRAGKSYQLTYTNEDGGTVALCGGGARGMRSEIARWGRGLDMEGVWAYGGAGRFERCTGTVPAAANAPRLIDDHPILYYGDGHNRIFESRGGYGEDCGRGDDKTPNGDFEGWGKTNNPGNDLGNDDPFTIVIRPVPVDMDTVGVTKYGGRREGIVDTFAPWLYRLVDSELARENKIDNDQTFPMTRYLFIDVYALDVGGGGDETCGPVSVTPGITHVSGGFRVRAIAKNGAVSNGPQMTADYFGGGGNGVKRVAVPLAQGVKAQDITKIQFDAYDGDGIYFVAIGDAFVPQPSGTNGATLEYVNKGMKSANVYVDDDKSSCTGDKNTKDGVAYACVGSAFTLSL